jgi:inner membrane protein
LDNLTHTLTGLMLARAGVAKGVPRAGLLLMVAANAPDIDIASWFGGPEIYLRYHRWITHALIAAPVMAAVAVLLARVFSKGKFPWARAGIAALVGVFSHVLLDWTNTYGIRLLLPFSTEWLRLDITNVIDLWIWAGLLLAVVAPALGKLVSSEIGAKSGAGRGWAVFALLFLLVYDFGRYVAHNRAVATLDSHIYDGANPKRVAAFPHFGNPLSWRGVVETSDAYRIFDLNLAATFDPTGGRVIYKPQDVPAFDAARQTPAFRTFLDFSSFPVWRTIPVPELEGVTRVEVFDLRFGDPQQPRFVADALIRRDGKVDEARFAFGPIRPR